MRGNDEVREREKKQHDNRLRKGEGNRGKERLLARESL